MVRAAGRRLALTKDGVTEIFASNVLGHAALLEGLIASGKLTRTAVYLGSEAARGFPKLGMKRPALPTSSVQDFVDIITGKDFAGKKFDAALAYGEVKYIAALWMAEQARRHPELRLLTVSPGNTQGTEIASAMPAPVRFLMQRVMMPIVAPLLGLAHSLETGAGRIVAGLTDPILPKRRFLRERGKEADRSGHGSEPNLPRPGEPDVSAERRKGDSHASSETFLPMATKKTKALSDRLSSPQRKAVPHRFVLDALADVNPTTRAMFGALAVYVRRENRLYSS